MSGRISQAYPHFLIKWSVGWYNISWSSKVEIVTLWAITLHCFSSEQFTHKIRGLDEHLRARTFFFSSPRVEKTPSSKFAEYSSAFRPFYQNIENMTFSPKERWSTAYDDQNIAQEGRIPVTWTMQEEHFNQVRTKITERKLFPISDVAPKNKPF